MPKLEQCFQFEAGAVRLDNGKYFRPLADAKECWVLRRRAPYEIDRTNFDILYLTSDSKFVHINYCHCELERRSDRKIWRSDSQPTGRIVDDRWAFGLLLRHQFDIPENLEDRFERATEPPPQPEPRPLDYWCQFDLVGRDSNQSISEIDLLQQAREVKNVAIRVVHLLRNWADGRQPSEREIVLRFLGAHLFDRYRVDSENWTGSVDEVPPDFVDLLQLSWPEEYRDIVAALEQLRSVIEAPLCAYLATRLSGHEGYPTADEQRMAKEALIAALPDVESGTVALNKAISAFARNPSEQSAETKTEPTEARQEMSASTTVVLPGQASDRESAAVADEHSLSIETWSALAIGIEEDGSFYAFSPAPATNDPIRLCNGVKLELTGTRWPKVLDCFARSDDGTSATKAELFTKLGYIRAGDVDRDQAEFSPDVKVAANRALRTLTGAMADLGRILRQLVKCPESQVFRSEGDSYCSGFVVRHLIRDEARRIRFGQPS